MGLAELERHAALTELNLTRCTRVSDRGLGSLARLPVLRALSLKQCIPVTNAGVAMLVTGLPRLERLNVEGCVHVTRRVLDAMTRHRPGLQGNLVC